ncbi:MAG: DsrE/DsrF/DrsH-like family protein [Candidatus Thermoplasmatota archaeon]|jgi:peroxiredoxin family protein|nr:DsrE/DsrF/DrsH-like family protein [Candidatus Thermoplasmatota archaeon]MCL5789255.1 DsrE/DsrF/DrsH-like family protein [Candidatus Thermoplasmatota archaeon]
MSKLSIILFSGTTDKALAAGVLAQAAAAMGSEVTIFVTFWGLMNFTKAEKKMVLPKEFEQMGPAMMQGMAKEHVKSWYEMMLEAKEFGAKIYACSMSAGVFGLKKEDLDPIIDDMVGAATYLQQSEDGQALFI